MAKSKKTRRIVIAVIVVTLLAASPLLCRKKDTTISVSTEKVARRDLTELIVANGKIQPVVQVVISPEVAGEIVALPVREGDRVKKGDLLVQIKADTYKASRNSAQASYLSAQASETLSKAEMQRAEAEFLRNETLFQNQLVSDSVILEFKTAYEVAKLRYTNSVHSVAQARYAVDKADEDLSKTTILSPIDGFVTRLQSQLGERVLGTSFNKGTEIMTVSDLSQMEARVDIGEVDVVLIKPGQKARLEVDAFRDKKFSGVVTEIANSSKGSTAAALSGGSSSQEATKFEVRIRINENEAFRPGMSVSTEIESRYVTNALTVPYAAVTTRMPKPDFSKSTGTNATASVTMTNTAPSTNAVATDKKPKDAPKQIEVVFVTESDTVKMVPVKIGITDGNHWEITSGLSEGEEFVSGSYKAVNKDLEDGKKITKNGGALTAEKK
ncbi:MAG: efflux RND transporter periplasmic adaptor subunit [Verrucomicrobiota bacterium]